MTNMKFKTADLVYGVPFFTGMILQVFAIDLFRLTFIPITVSGGLYIVAALIGFVLLRQKIKETFRKKFLDIIVSLTWAFVSFGGNLTFLLLGVNYYLAKDGVTKQTFPIVKTGMLDKGLFTAGVQPFFEIKKDGLIKQVIFQYNLPKDISTYETIDLTISKGALGFDISRDKKPIEKKQ